MPADDSEVRKPSASSASMLTPGESRPRPMIAILDARPGMTSRLREIVAELARQVRREPCCLDFTAYQARDTPDRFCQVSGG
jgi:hypothetical protein